MGNVLVSLTCEQADKLEEILQMNQTIIKQGLVKDPTLKESIDDLIGTLHVAEGIYDNGEF